MNQYEAEQFERISVYTDDEMKLEIIKISKEKKWSIAYVGYVLMQQAIKERNRKKRAAEKNHS